MRTLLQLQPEGNPRALDLKQGAAAGIVAGGRLCGAVAGGGNHSLALVPSPSQVCRSRVVKPGEDYLLTVPLSVGQAARLQWYHDGVLVQSGSTLWLPTVHSGDLGQYVAVSQFPFGRVTNAVNQLRFDAALPARLSLEAINGLVYRFRLSGEPNVQYTVLTTTNQLPVAPWLPVLDLTLTNGYGVFDWTNTGEPRRFFQALRP